MSGGYLFTLFKRYISVSRYFQYFQNFSNDHEVDYLYLPSSLLVYFLPKRFFFIRVFITFECVHRRRVYHLYGSLYIKIIYLLQYMAHTLIKFQGYIGNVVIPNTRRFMHHKTRNCVFWREGGGGDAG